MKLYLQNYFYKGTDVLKYKNYDYTFLIINYNKNGNEEII